MRSRRTQPTLSHSAILNGSSTCMCTLVSPSPFGVCCSVESHEGCGWDGRVLRWRCCSASCICFCVHGGQEGREEGCVLTHAGTLDDVWLLRAARRHGTVPADSIGAERGAWRGWMCLHREPSERNLRTHQLAEASYFSSTCSPTIGWRPRCCVCRQEGEEGWVNACALRSMINPFGRG